MYIDKIAEPEKFNKAFSGVCAMFCLLFHLFFFHRQAENSKNSFSIKEQKDELRIEKVQEPIESRDNVVLRYVYTMHVS